VERAFFVYMRPHRWNMYIPAVYIQGISYSRLLADFQCTMGVFNFNFRIRRNVHFSKYNLRPPQQLGISFVDNEISFVRIADLFCILYRFLKICKICSFDPIYPPLSIFYYLSFKTYLLKPILQNLSSNTYPLVDFV